MSSPTPHGVDRLAPRELAIARLIAADQSTAEIAAEFSVSEKTVKAQVRTILLKLGVRTRAGIATAICRADTAPTVGAGV